MEAVALNRSCEGALAQKLDEVLQNTIIVLDFDDMMFKTQKMLNEYAKVFAMHGFSADNFWEVYEETKKRVGFFSPETMLDIFSALRNFDVQKARSDLDKVLSDTSDYIYKDFEIFARQINPKKMIILTFGDEELQKKKIYNSGVVPFVGKVIITPQKKKTVFEKQIIPHNPHAIIVFIDDRAPEIDLVKEAFPQIITFKMNRPEGRHRDELSKKADYLVTDLHHTLEILWKIFGNVQKSEVCPFDLQAS
jgi:hypothetical protein